jgi:hypothetical protein
MNQNTGNLIATAVRIGTTAGAMALAILGIWFLMPAHSEFWLICFAPLAAVSLAQFALAGFLRLRGE